MGKYCLKYFSIKNPLETAVIVFALDEYPVPLPASIM